MKRSSAQAPIQSKVGAHGREEIQPREGLGEERGRAEGPRVVRSQLHRGENDHGNLSPSFDTAEQHAASDGLYNLIRGVHNFTGAPRRVRLGLELNF